MPTPARLSAEPLSRVLPDYFGRYSYPVALGVVIVGITYLSLVIGELVPKRIAFNNPERVAAAVAPFMTRLSMVGAPIVYILQTSTDTLMRLLRVPEKPENTVTEEEVKRLIAEGARTGIFHVAERDMINGVLRLADRSVRSVMTPRVEVVWIDLDDPPEDDPPGDRRQRALPISRGPQGPRRAGGDHPHQASLRPDSYAPADSILALRFAIR